jgi:hypothetical protein
MFTDLVGYTTMVGSDESRARQTRAMLRTLLTDVLGNRRGTLIQSFGDGTLSVFPSAVEAALAAADIQRRLADQPGIELRIGLHLGEVAYDTEGVYGDAVNVAARIQAIATPGSVLVSEEISQQLRNHREVPFTSVGTVMLKNVADPMHVFALTLDTLAVPTVKEVARRARESGGAAAKEERAVPRSLAVLPLANLSGDAAQEYFVAGMHEALLTELARINLSNVCAPLSRDVRAAPRYCSLARRGSVDRRIRAARRESRTHHGAAHRVPSGTSPVGRELRWRPE